MDNHFGDLYGMISDREIEISHELAQYVLEYEAVLTTSSDICGELDRPVCGMSGESTQKLKVLVWLLWHKALSFTTCLAHTCRSRM
jgi:hypothetical protein